MRLSIQFFKLAKLNSELKYVANSVNHGEAPQYANPGIKDFLSWQNHMLERLDEWSADMPPQDSENAYVHQMCQIYGESLRIVLLRPSPAIPNPSAETLDSCYEATTTMLRLIIHLYEKSLLVYTWDMVYSVVLSFITRMYCIRKSPKVVKRVDRDALSSDIGDICSVLSAMGEHWPGAKRCRTTLDDLGRAVIRWIKELESGTSADDRNEPASISSKPLPASAGATAVPARECNIGDTRREEEAQQSTAALRQTFETVPHGRDVSPMAVSFDAFSIFNQDSFNPLFGTVWTDIPTSMEDSSMMVRSIFDDFILNSS